LKSIQAAGIPFPVRSCATANRPPKPEDTYKTKSPIRIAIPPLDEQGAKSGQKLQWRCEIIQNHGGPVSSDITQLLQAWKGGDREAAEQLAAGLYNELRRIARKYMRQERSGHTLQTTALVNEAYLRLVGVRMEFHDRVHFFAFAAQTMRRVLVDYARSRGYAKRGAGAAAVPLIDGAIDLPDRSADIVALDDALSELARHDPRKARVIELRFFGGLSVEETAAALSVSPQTVLRDWSLAKAWLTRELNHARSS
jgi:RNA polymerase sigma factor (TIGR02999 family)